MKSLRIFLFGTLLATAAVCAQLDLDSCVDEPDSLIAALAAEAGYDQIDSCSSPFLAAAIKNAGLCKAQTPQGRKMRELCCRTCLDYYFPMPETQLPSNGGGILGSPVKLYLQAGQSECVGQASTGLLRQHESETGEYSDLVVEQNDVYFAHYADAPISQNRGPQHPSRFFIAKMEIGKDRASTLGPEAAIGRRLQDASPTDDDIVIVKYCWGGSRAATHWNPDSSYNNWPRDLDDGSSDYLLNVGAAELTSKDNLYGNLIYTARRVAEALTNAGVSYEWSGLFWLQGSGDKESTWEEYGNDLKRLFTRIREDIGVPDLPIVDEGAGPDHGLYSGKIYAASTIPGCNVKVANPNFGVLDPESDCEQTASNVCLDLFNNLEPLEFYGVDPGMYVPPFSDLIPEDLLTKNFTWYKSLPTNQHSEYDGMILKGRMMANEFIRTFTDWTLTPDMTSNDPIVLFPSLSCGRPDEPTFTAPGYDNLCYVDERDDAAIADVSCNVETGNPTFFAEGGGLRKM